MSTPKDRARWNAYDAAHREERRAKDRLRYSLNKERLRAKNKTYHAKHRTEILKRQAARRLIKGSQDGAYKKQWRLNHPEETRAQTQKWYHAISPEERRKRNAVYSAKYAEQRRQWRERNKERLKQVSAEWARRNMARKRAAAARRLAAKIRATPPWINLAAIRKFYKEAARLTRDTGIDHEVDHIVPLRNPLVCGLHVSWNLQILTKEENRRKHNRLIAA